MNITCCQRKRGNNTRNRTIPPEKEVLIADMPNNPHFCTITRIENCHPLSPAVCLNYPEPSAFSYIKRNDKWVVKRRKFWSYSTIIVEKSAIIFSWNLWFSNGWCHVWKLTSVSYWFPTPHPPIVECHVIGQWIDIKIVKLCIHKAAGSRINEVIFPSFSWTDLFIIY